MSSDIARIRRDVSLVQTATGFGVPLKKDGGEWLACCPFHAEDTASFTVFMGRDHVERFHCFGCGEKGDVLDFVQKIKGVELPDAIAILGGKDSARPNVAPRKVEVRDVYEGIDPRTPPREIEPGARVTLYNPKRAGTEREWGAISPSLVHPYRKRDGELIGYVLRHDLRDGGKETPMVMWVRLPNGKECWSRFPLPKPRPLYGLDKLKDGQVIVVEGEKCRDALAAATKRNVVSWPGGTQGARHVDWSPLAGRKVVLWPDADEPGLVVANEIAAILTAHGVPELSILDVADKPKGWDAADAVRDGWGAADLDGFMRERKRRWVAPEAPEPSNREEAPARLRVVDGGRQAVAREARAVEQAKPKPDAVVTDFHTRQQLGADDLWMTKLVTNTEGAVKPGVAFNWSLFLENHEDMRGVLGWDAFKLNVTLMRRPPWDHGKGDWKPRAITDRDISEIVMWLESADKFRPLTPRVSNIAPVIQAVAERNSFDPLCDYLRGLKWDGTPRVMRFAADYLGCADDDYSETVSRCWLISSVARGLRPGCKVDTMPVLEGPQGLQKSTMVKKLYGEQFFTDDMSDINSKDAKIEMQGVWVVEVAEMHRLSNAESNAVKKFLSRQIDRFRPPFGKVTIEAARRCVMVGTINPEGVGYLRDQTGNRRFWPLECGAIDIKKIERDRDQIWAEAVQLFNAGVPWWVQNDEMSAVVVQQEMRSDQDAWVAKIVPLIKGAAEISQWEIFEGLGIPAREVDYKHTGRVGRIMKKLGWSSARLRDNGQDRIVFRAPKGGDQLAGDW